MAAQNFPDNVLYNMDNLDVLRGMNSETVDLIATDPPFNKKRNRAASAGMYEDAWRWEDDPSMVDRPDQWLWQPVHRIWLDQIKDENPALFSVIEATRLTQDDDTAAFLCFLGVRLLAMHRVLKPTGSIYLHCDHSANAYIRMVMDAVFGAKNFRNEIAWCYKTRPQAKKHFGRKHDTILFYSKTATDQFNWKAVARPLSEESKKKYRLTDKEGRRYRLQGRGITNSPIRSAKDVNPEWEEKHPELVVRDYLENKIGVALEDWWIDIGIINQAASERTGSPDQKPLALYERIIKASSNSGDLVLDPFAGCATTPIAAHNLGRRWVGIDRREDAAYHITNRLLGLGINVDEFKVQQQALIPELQGSCEIRYEAPVRTDGGETAAPGLAQVFNQRRPALMSHREMKNLLIQHCGLFCWGCNFIAPDPRHLALDHINPKADGGSNDLDNRSLMCTPCNTAKGNRMTLSALRRQNRKDGYLTKKDSEHSINLKETLQWSRNYMVDEIRGTPHQMTLGGG